MHLRQRVPGDEAPAEVRSRVWERITRVTDALGPIQPTGVVPPLPPPASRPSPLAPCLPFASPITLSVAKLAAALLTASLLGAGATAAALAERDRPPWTPAVNVGHDVPVASAFTQSDAEAPAPLLVEGDARAAAQPQASANPSAEGMTEPADTEAAERLLLQHAPAALELARPDPAEALRLLLRYDEAYPHSTRFNEERARIGHDALSLQRSAGEWEP